MENRKDPGLPSVELLTDSLKETGQNFDDLKCRAELTKQGAVLFILNGRLVKQQRWNAYRFTPELLADLREMAAHGPDALVRARAEAVLQYHEGLPHWQIARTINRCRNYVSALAKAVVKEGVSEGVLRNPHRHLGNKVPPPQQAQ
jgi:hypothetical protein